jgi:peptide/nickel transport system substrate-binding protein
VGTDLSVISHLYSSLVVRGPDLKLQPQVADSWQATSDTSWRFKLHPGITFLDGEKLDATAVKWNIDRVLNPDTKARVKSWFDLVSAATVVDDLTLDVTTTSPYPAFVDQLSMFYLLPPKWASENNPAAKALGTGPYTLREWVKDDHVTLDANPNYWGPAPQFKTVIFRAVPEVSSRVAGLLSGDLDIITGVAPADFDRITAAGLTAGSTPSTRSAFVKFNTLLKPLDDVRVRQALNYAVDKDTLIKNIFNNTTAKSNGEVLTGAYFGYNPDLKPYDYDLAKAKELLSEAGQANGFQAELDVPSGTYLLGSETSQAIAGQLAQVGVQAKVTEMPFSVYMDKYLPQKNLAPMAYITQAWPTLDADGLLSLFEAGNQYAYWNDQQFSDFLKQARSTTNQQQRLELYKQATARMRDQAPVLFLFPQPATYATGKSVEWKARPDDWVRAWDVQPK